MAHPPLTAHTRGIFPLSRDGIAERLRLPPPAPEQNDLHVIALREGARVTEAAVLVPLVNHDGAVTVMFTQRTAHLNDHAGQICFPGGRVETGDSGREDTALRETEE
ncbi:MAG: NUDIX domain-containing protein, partial [Burkholderiales bacterium]|nr:NUDIX domain-containing protein [Burkholderiales bacterium]